MWRSLPGLAAFHVLGILLADLGSLELWLWAGLHGAAFGFAAPRLRIVAALAVALAAGGTAGSRAHAGAGRASGEAPFDAVLEGRVVDVAAGRGGPRLVLQEVVAVDRPGEPPPGGLLLFAGEAPALARAAAGDWVRVAARVTPADRPRNPGGPDVAASLARRGIAGFATPSHPAASMLFESAAPKGFESLQESRDRGVRRLTERGPGGGLLAALGLGERSGISAASRVALARLGLAHLVAVSGLHLVLVAAPLYLALTAALRRSASLSGARRGAVAVAGPRRSPPRGHRW
jgi:competence protein ComEC